MKKRAKVRRGKDTRVKRGENGIVFGGLWTYLGSSAV